MNGILLWLGRVAGVAGLLACAAAVVVRLSGAYWIGGFQVGTLLGAGTALIGAGCFLLLLVRTGRDD